MENKYQDLNINSENGMLTELYPQGEIIPSIKELIELNKTLIEEISKIPASGFENYNSTLGARNNPCENCPNNPKNNPFSSGFCNCALPALANPIY